MSTSQYTTQSVTINVTSRYVTERGEEDAAHYLYAYKVHIKNEGETAVKLLSRHWVITDSNEQIEEVWGPGVVGEQPLLGQGETFTYSSACILKTPQGMMHGHYEMLRRGGDVFQAKIAPFTLSQPLKIH
ncbi:MAG: Co2+/Mg2+ efflux protein ApaG [Myxococcales bacterium]|nr:Co2+/Mg2+ efflux protein ApaG [Myxococcales bacterium]